MNYAYCSFRKIVTYEDENHLNAFTSRQHYVEFYRDYYVQ